MVRMSRKLRQPKALAPCGTIQLQSLELYLKIALAIVALATAAAKLVEMLFRLLE